MFNNEIQSLRARLQMKVLPLLHCPNCFFSVFNHSHRRENSFEAGRGAMRTSASNLKHISEAGLL